MIKELVQFTDALDEELKAAGVLPKEGLHVMLSHKEIGDITTISKDFKYEIFSKKQKEVSSFLKLCETLRQLTWMIDTNKAIDKTTRAIHSCSPFCLAIKRDNLVGGKNYEQRKRDKKALVYNSLSNYFNTVLTMTEGIISDAAKAFSVSLKGQEEIHSLLDSIPEYQKLKDNEYVIFYLDVPKEEYEKAYRFYFTDELIFNKATYNNKIGDEWYGASGFLNGFNDEKPFLKHQSATFSIAGRISAKEAKSLFEFENIAARRVLPNPLPIFVYADEREASISLFKRDALEGGSKRGYKEIVEELQKKLEKELGNYYLLFYQAVEKQIRDFDFVSKFEYNLKDHEGKAWYVDDLFNSKRKYTISNVFEFERIILPIIFNNALIVKTKTDGLLFKYFDDIDASYCKTDNTFLLVLKYRKALYDFIYKSNRTVFTKHVFEDIVFTSLLDDIRLDKFEGRQHSEDFPIRQKLNILFGLYHHFQPNKQVNSFMPTTITALRKSMESLASGEADIASDEQFAFVAGQVIYYILSKSKSSDKSYSRLEPFLQLTDAGRLKQTAFKIFNTYKHERFSKRFNNPFAQVMAYNTHANLKDLMPLLLAGFFSENQLFGKGSEEEPVTTKEITNA